MAKARIARVSDVSEDLAPVREGLLRWFAVHQRDLPWRRTRDPYAIWLSEVMLQQTQVVTVIPYWERFLARFPTLEALAAAALPDVLSLWRGLGYYSRARNLHRAAQDMVAHHGGRLPADLEALHALPGFGRYTAGAVASIAFGLPAPVVDGNVARVLSRLFEVTGAPGDRVREARLWALAGALVASGPAGDLNQALMELGALICRPDPTCLVCPVREACRGLRNHRLDELPPPKARAARKSLSWVAAVWRREGRVFLARRREGGLFGGLWELPSAEGDEAAAAESLSALFGTRVALGAQLAEVKRTLTHRDLTVRVFAARGVGAKLGGTLPAEGPYVQSGWFTEAEAEALGMSTAMSHALRAALRSPARRASGRAARV